MTDHKRAGVPEGWYFEASDDRVYVTTPSGKVVGMTNRPEPAWDWVFDLCQALAATTAPAPDPVLVRVVPEGWQSELLTNIKRSCIRGRNSAGLPATPLASSYVAMCDHIESMVEQLLSAAPAPEAPEEWRIGIVSLLSRYGMSPEAAGCFASEEWAEFLRGECDCGLDHPADIVDRMMHLAAAAVDLWKLDSASRPEGWKSPVVPEADPIPLLPCPICGGGAIHATQVLARTIIAPETKKAGKALAWLVDWPNEPHLRHFFSESPVDGARCRPLYAHPAPPAAGQAEPEKAKPCAFRYRYPNEQPDAPPSQWYDISELPNRAFLGGRVVEYAYSAPPAAVQAEGVEALAIRVSGWICEARNEWAEKHEAAWLDETCDVHPDTFAGEYIARRLAEK